MPELGKLQILHLFAPQGLALQVQGRLSVQGRAVRRSTPAALLFGGEDMTHETPGSFTDVQDLMALWPKVIAMCGRVLDSGMDGPANLSKEELSGLGQVLSTLRSEISEALQFLEEQQEAGYQWCSPEEMGTEA